MTLQDKTVIEAARNLIDRAASTYTARNGRQVGIQGDDGEMCWIVHSDELEELRRALAKISAPVEDEGVVDPAHVDALGFILGYSDGAWVMMEPSLREAIEAAIAAMRSTPEAEGGK